MSPVLGFSSIFLLCVADKSKDEKKEQREAAEERKKEAERGGRGNKARGSK